MFYLGSALADAAHGPECMTALPSGRFGRALALPSAAAPALASRGLRDGPWTMHLRRAVPPWQAQPELQLPGGA
eukprot:15435630-Alexandrium_andersonii.AAC.1